ncbi:MAG: phosphorylcholine transferase LicD, partial [Candidatus Faecivicinus sp.]
DVVMARPDYDRLVKLCEADAFGPDTRFACYENGLFMRPFARIYNLKTRVQRKYYINSSGPHVWIDILPVDGLPADPKALEHLYWRRWHLNRLNCGAMWRVGCASRKLYVLKKWTYYPLARIPGARFWGGRLDRLGRSRPYADSDTVGCLTGGRYGVGEAMPRAAFEIPAKVTFEGRECETMSCWKEYLTGIYGDYMKLPPESQRVPHLDYATMSRQDYEALCARRQAAPLNATKE